MYQTCPEKWRLHYREKLRDRFTSAALLFGSAVDAVCNRILQDLQAGPSVYDFTFHTYNNVFTLNWRHGFINKAKVDLFDNESLVYAESDFDEELLTEADLQTLSSFLFNFGIAYNPDQVLTFYKEVSKRKKTEGFANLPVELRKFINYTNWLCMFHKGILMFKAYKEQIIPKIKKVLSVQKEIKLTNEDGDSIIGYIDGIIEWEDGSIVVFDHKTSAREYDADAVLTSPQLSLYINATRAEFNVEKAGYIIFRKSIFKNRIKTCSKCKHESKGRAKTCDNQVAGQRCKGEWVEKINPEANINVLIDRIPERSEEIVLENFIDINNAIKNEVFTRNLSACDSPFKCPYKDLCWKNDKTNLIKVE